MKFKMLNAILLVCLGSAAVPVFANEVLLTSDQPVKITFQVAHANQGGQPVLGELRTLELNKNATVHIELDGYTLAGIVPISVDGHVLPQSANQFDKPQQCSMTTDKVRATGTLQFKVSQHDLTCSTFGGVFG